MRKKLKDAKLLLPLLNTILKIVLEWMKHK
jgi:hypothetical protein